MKKIITLFILVSFAFIVSCANSKDITINGQTKTYETYGLLNQDEEKDGNIKYKTSKGNVFWSIVLCETIFVPIILIGYYLYEPVGEK